MAVNNSNPKAAAQTKSFPVKNPFIIIFLTIISLFLAIYAYQSNKNQGIQTRISDNNILKDPTADWKEYKNEELGFSFKYPKEWGEVEFLIKNAWPAPSGAGKKFTGGFTNYGKLQFGGVSADFFEGRSAVYSDFKKYIKKGNKYFFPLYSDNQELVVSKIININAKEPALVIDIARTYEGVDRTKVLTLWGSNSWGALVNLEGPLFGGIAFSGDIVDADTYELLISSFVINI